MCSNLNKREPTIVEYVVVDAVAVVRGNEQLVESVLFKQLKRK